MRGREVGMEDGDPYHGWLYEAYKFKDIFGYEIPVKKVEKVEKVEG